MRGSKGVYCSKECMHEERKSSLPDWFNCSKCLAEIGIGHQVASRLLHTNKARIHRAWKKQGVTVAVPECGSWSNYKRAWRNTWWGGRDNATLWMSDYNPSFPDWSGIAQKAMAEAKYQGLSEEDRKAHNKRCGENRKKAWAKDPEKKRRDMERIKEWRRRNPEKNSENKKEWRRRNPEKNRESQRQSIRNRKKRDPAFRVLCNLRDRFKDIMKSARDPKGSRFSGLTGCTTTQLREHIQSQFNRGMNWDNYGTHWHVDHKLPCASFDHNNKAHIKQCWHFANLAPLEAKKNLAKSDTITHPQMFLTL
tara:strand:- start:63 stop:986 length:924 start_codon:yes stop_codon:yes gene_type:complete